MDDPTPPDSADEEVEEAEEAGSTAEGDDTGQDEAATDEAAGEPEDLRTVNERLLEVGTRMLESIWSLQWRKGFFWGSLIGLVWILYDFLPIIILTFVLSYIGNTIVNYLGKADGFIERTTGGDGQPPSRILLTVVVYVVLIGVVVGFGAMTLPAVYDQGRQIGDQVQAVSVEKVEEWATPWLGESYAGEFREYLEADETQAAMQEWVRGAGLEHAGEIFLHMAGMLLEAGLFIIISFILSFLIVLQLPKLGQQIQTLGDSRIGDFYDEIAPGVKAFGGLMGKMLQAQTLVAICNTILTAIGLRILGLEGILFLSIIVFVCSFIPVLGVFISSAPICLAGLLQAPVHSGVASVLIIVGLIVLIHFVEAYFLNPHIYGHHLEMHPLAVLIILIVAEHMMGLWGFILGVPLSVYVYQHVILGEAWEEEGIPAAPATAQPG